MIKRFTGTLLLGALITMPAAGFAAPAGKLQATTAAKHTAAPATRATRGVVKSIDASTLVITTADKKHPEMTFALNTSTERGGTVAVGSPVSVRYHMDGKTMMATAITVQPAKTASKPKL
jgi:hypothetical protein